MPTDCSKEAREIPQPGEIWETRNGKKTEPLEANDHDVFPLVGKVGEVEHTWTANGHWTLDTFYHYLDLVRRIYPPEEPGGAMSDIKWEVGKKYVTRNGIVMTLVADVRKCGVDKNMPLVFVCEQNVTARYADGRASPGGTIIGYDIVAEWSPHVPHDEGTAQGLLWNVVRRTCGQSLFVITELLETGVRLSGVGRDNIVPLSYEALANSFVDVRTGKPVAREVTP